MKVAARPDTCSVIVATSPFSVSVNVPVALLAPFRGTGCSVALYVAVDALLEGLAADELLLEGLLESLLVAALLPQPAMAAATPTAPIPSQDACMILMRYSFTSSRRALMCESESRDVSSLPAKPLRAEGDNGSLTFRAERAAAPVAGRPYQGSEVRD